VIEGAIMVGTVGQGVMRSTDGGECWRRQGVDDGLHSDAIVRALAVHPTDSRIVFAGSDRGLYRSDDSGAKWRRQDVPFNESWVWTLAIDPSRPERIFAGIGTPTPAALYRSVDGGRQWRRCQIEIAAKCDNVGTPRPTAIAVDPANGDLVWLGIEVDGVRVSSDGGEVWGLPAAPIANPDIHNIVVALGPPKTVFVVTSDSVLKSTDDGRSWTSTGLTEVEPSLTSYPRGIAPGPRGTSEMWITSGNTTPGETGSIVHTQDFGSTWVVRNLSHAPNSAMWCISTHSDQQNVMFAASRYGYLYSSEDAGSSWQKLEREFGEIATVVALRA
jgi:photosystem II stability/assembly factor-like uncharacterized protein